MLQFTAGSNSLRLRPAQNGRSTWPLQQPARQQQSSIRRHHAVRWRTAVSVEGLIGNLPIREVIHEIVHSLDTHSGLVLQAPPGAGKTTTVPLALLLHKPDYLRDEQKILVLEPRRVAAKAAARRMSSLLGESVGATVGYRVRLESRVSGATRIEVVTEGILIRMIQDDPTLEGVGVVILDEFHERSLDADTALTLSLDVQAWARPDLRVVVMSATLGGGLAQDLQHLMSHHTTATDSTGSNDQPSSSGSSSSRVPVIVSEGRSYPVTTHFLGRPYQKRGELEAAAASAILTALSSPDAAGGDVLVFLPGVGEIRRLQQILMADSAVRRAGVAVVQLHGNLPPQQQDDVIRPNRTRLHRRIVLSTPIAESSITIDGVTAVVDTGLRRSPMFDPATCISRLVTQRISRDSAEQRTGRAGRTQPGVCYRLWSSDDHDQLLPSTPPEIVSADLSPLALTLANWGCLAEHTAASSSSSSNSSSSGGGVLPWLDEPDPVGMQEATDLLLDLAAVDDKRKITDTGRRMSSLPVHPRFAHMVLRAQCHGVTKLGCVLAALLSERDMFRTTSSSSSQAGSSDLGADLTARLKVMAGLESAPVGFDQSAADRVTLGAQQIIRQLEQATQSSNIPITVPTPSSKSTESSGSAVSTLDELDEAESSMDDESETTMSALVRHSHQPSARAFRDSWVTQMSKAGLVGALVCAAYPDRIAQLKPGSGGKPDYTLKSGRVVSLSSASDPLSGHQYIAVAELLPGRDGRNDRITLGAALTTAAIQTYLADEIQDRTVVFWAAASKCVLAKQQRVLGSLVMAEQQVKVEDEAALPVLIKGLRDGGYTSLGVPAAAESWRSRAAWLHDAELAATGSSAVPDMSTAALMADLASWLGPHLSGVRNKAQLQKLPWLDIFRGMMDWCTQQHVEACASSHLVLPTGSKVPINYSSSSPTAAVKMQEVFGLADTPLLGGQRVNVPLVLELMSPAGRPLQETSNLASFWAESYSAVKKEMKGRYPKHFWPDDPANTAPTNMTKKQMAKAGHAPGKGGPAGAATDKPAAMTTTNRKRR